MGDYTYDNDPRQQSYRRRSFSRDKRATGGFNQSDRIPTLDSTENEGQARRDNTYHNPQSYRNPNEDYQRPRNNGGEYPNAGGKNYPDNHDYQNGNSNDQTAEHLQDLERRYKHLQSNSYNDPHNTYNNNNQPLPNSNNNNNNNNTRKFLPSRNKTPTSQSRSAFSSPFKRQNPDYIDNNPSNNGVGGPGTTQLFINNPNNNNTQTSGNYKPRYETPREKYRTGQSIYKPFIDLSSGMAPSGDTRSDTQRLPPGGTNSNSARYPNGSIHPNDLQQISPRKLDMADPNSTAASTLSSTDPLKNIDLDGASREQLQNIIKLMKRQDKVNVRLYQNEIDALTMKISRTENQPGYDREQRIRDLENRLRDREKELDMVHVKLKSGGTNPADSMMAKKQPVTLDALPQKNLNASNKPAGTVNAWHFANEGLLEATTHGKIKRATVWSNSERIYGISFAYLQQDGTMLICDETQFRRLNLKGESIDFDVDNHKEYLQTLTGKYNIKGVSQVVLAAPTGKQRTFTYQVVPNNGLDAFKQPEETFNVKFDYIDHPMKIVFPNVFSYSMKGATIPERHDQNFFYLESTRCLSLANPSLSTVGQNAAPQKKVASAVVTKKQAPDNSDKTGHYYSDNADAINVMEVSDNDRSHLLWTDADLIFYEKLIKIHQITIYYDQEFIYGFEFTYIPNDKHLLISGKKHVGVVHLDKQYTDMVFDQPNQQLSKITFYKSKQSTVQKLVVFTSDGKKKEFGKPVADRDAIETTLEIKPSFYLYGTFIPNPNMKFPGDFVLSDIRIGEIKAKP